MRRALMLDHPWRDLRIEQDLLAKHGVQLVSAQEAAYADWEPYADEFEAVGVCWRPVPAATIARLKRCKIIARFGVGLDNIDVSAATAAGIPVTFVPDYCVSEVADHTLALMLALLRGVNLFDRSMKAGEYLPELMHPRRLDRLTLGIIGFGRIGQAVAARATAFGMNVIAASRSQVIVPAVHQISLPELIGTADVVSLHLPLSATTRHLINAERLGIMKRSALLINTSRGGLVDASALEDALRQNRIAAAALDVFETEPLPPDHSLRSAPHLTLTPHVAFRSVEAVVELRSRAAEQMLSALQGQRPPHVINPAVYSNSSNSEPV